MSDPREPVEETPGGPAAATPPVPDDALIIVPVRGMVLFPGLIVPIAVGRKRSVDALQAAMQVERPLGLLLQREAHVDDPQYLDLHQIGTIARVVRYLTAPDGTNHIIAQGIERFRVTEWLTRDPFFTARYERIAEKKPEGEEAKEIEGRSLALREQVLELIRMLPEPAEGLELAIRNAKTPGAITDMAATFLDLPPAEKQELLETIDLRLRMEKVGEKLRRHADVMRISQEIRESAAGSMQKAQRDFYLREQLKAIKRELGEGEGADLKELEEAIADAGMPEEVEKEARKELTRLEAMSEASPESGIIRNYLDWLVSLPWSKSSEDLIDLERARAVLDEDHFGLEKIKRRILEFLAVRKLNPTGRSPILCFVGPPGVGKTSLGRSIARAMNREYVRIALGGVHDEAEIRGHRRTYIGAMPGNVIQGIRRAGTNNPVFILDEMDKVSASFHGDPASALLEVLDPEQNVNFRDNYLNVPFDLSKVLFIGTANVLDGIPGPLRDRCEIIQLAGYTDDEKLSIARKYLVPRQLEQNGLKAEQLEITDAALRVVVEGYTREAGVRNLEREIGALARHAAVRVASGEVERVRIDEGDVATVLGPVKFENEVALRTSVAGVATGMAWTPFGGDVLFIEATRSPGRGKLLLTGQIGDVMRESAQAALTLVKSQASALGVELQEIQDSDLHIHIPAGAIPKDGPSAGVTMYTALVSLFTGQNVRSDVAMTGEISLRGLVLPVGGIKEKVLAAHRAGIHKVLLPRRNMKDLEDVPEKVRRELEFVPLEHVSEIPPHALEDGRERRERSSVGEHAASDGGPA